MESRNSESSPEWLFSNLLTTKIKCPLKEALSLDALHVSCEFPLYFPNLFYKDFDEAQIIAGGYAIVPQNSFFCKTFRLHTSFLYVRFCAEYPI